MKKYLSIMSANIKQNMQSLSNIIISIAGNAFIMYVLISLWKFMYEGEESVIYGYTVTMTTWYVVVGESIQKLLSGSELVGGINDDIRLGSIAYKINKPYFYPFYILFNFLGRVVSKFIPQVIFAVIFGSLIIGKLETFKVQYIPFMIIPVILSVLVHSFIKITIGTLAFWVEDSFPFTWIYEKMLLVFGACFPVDMFPEKIQNIVALTPIYGVIYGPARLIINFNWGDFFEIVISQIFWVIVTMLICFSVYKRGAKNVNVNGG